MTTLADLIVARQRARQMYIASCERGAPLATVRRWKRRLAWLTIRLALGRTGG